MGSVSFDGKIKALLIGNHLKLSNFMYPKLGTDRLICTGEFSRHASGQAFSIPLNCTNGRHGTAVITLDGKSHTWGQESYVTFDGHSSVAGTGSFHLVDGSTGWFVFGESILSGCGCSSLPAGSEQDLIANVGDRVFFAYDKSVLSVDADATLHRQANWLNKYSYINILIAGNADERGTETYDLALGNRRADTARDYLLSEGVSASRIQTISYGKDRPVATGQDEASYQQNRTAITSVQGFNTQVSP